MAAEPQHSPMEAVPDTPKIREVRPESGPENFEFCTGQCHVPGSEPNLGVRRVSLRAEIDTSPPFGSVKEAVTRFGGSGPWVPLYKFAEAYHGIEEFDLKKVEEQTAELEKNLIVKELETLDVLEELGTTKKIVEELKRQLQNEAMKCMNTGTSTGPDLDSDAAIKEMNKEHHEQEVRIGCSKPCLFPVSSHDSILMELKQAKLNLGKTINDLGVIQASVECLNKKMKKEKSLLEKTRQRLANKPEQFKEMVDPTNTEVPRSMPCIKTAEMRWIAAKKMEEAAMAAKALAVIEMKGLSNNGNSAGFCLPEPSPRTPNGQRAEISILRKMEEASMEVKHGKEALEDALNRIEIANRKQLDAEEAMRRWFPLDQEPKKHVVYNTARINDFPLPHPHPHPHQQIPRSPLNLTIDDGRQNPVSRTTVSMGDILNRKQVPSTTERQKVALSQMLHELREDQLAFSPKPDKKDQQKQYLSQRRKFGFIHISLKKKSQA